MNSYIIKITSNYPPIIEQMIKDKDYLNELYMNLECPFYCEFFLDGFLIITENITAFRKLCFDDMTIEKITQSQPQIDKNQSKMENLFRRYVFPKRGITFTVDLVNINAKNFFKFINSKFGHIHPDVKINVNQLNQIIIHFATYDAIELFANLNQSFIDKIEMNYIISC